MPLMLDHQGTMLSALTEPEQAQLCALLDKLVIASPHWPAELDAPTPAPTTAPTITERSLT
jgi:hypothetical protein